MSATALKSNLGAIPRTVDDPDLEIVGSYARVENIPTSPSSTTSALRIPDFSTSGSVYAVTARMAGRINAANISDEEYDSLLTERQSLLGRKFEGTMTKRESNRLEYIRWTLDRIEDAKYGYVLDEIETRVVQYEKLIDDMRQFQANLEAHKRHGR